MHHLQCATEFCRKTTRSVRWANIIILVILLVIVAQNHSRLLTAGVSELRAGLPYFVCHLNSPIHYRPQPQKWPQAWMHTSLPHKTLNSYVSQTLLIARLLYGLAFERPWCCVHSEHLSRSHYQITVPAFIFFISMYCMLASLQPVFSSLFGIPNPLVSSALLLISAALHSHPSVLSLPLSLSHPLHTTPLSLWVNQQMRWNCM